MLVKYSISLNSGKLLHSSLYATLQSFIVQGDDLMVPHVGLDSYLNFTLTSSDVDDYIH